MDSQLKKAVITHEQDRVKEYLNFQNLDENYIDTLSYLHRLFAEYYNPGWNPHFYTGLYCSFGLYQSDKVKDDSTAKRSLSNKVVGAEYLPPAYMAIYSIQKTRRGLLATRI